MGGRRGGGPCPGRRLLGPRAGIGPGSILYYVPLPYSEVVGAEGLLVDGAWDLNITKNDWIQATAYSGLFYEFDFDLRCVQVSWGHNYMRAHAEAVRAGKIASDLDDDAYRDDLRRGVRYWDGAAWTAEPARSPAR